MVCLVALRVAVGWHFYQQGLKKLSDPQFSSESFLKQAKGPLQSTYWGMIPDFHDFNRHVDQWQRQAADAAREAAKPVDTAKAAEKPKPKEKAPPSPLAEWSAKVVAGWGEYFVAVQRKHTFSEEKKAIGQAALEKAQDDLNDAVDTAEAWIRKNPQEIVSLERVASDPLVNQVPFSAERVQTQTDKVRPITTTLLNQAKDIEKKFQANIDNHVLTNEQRQQGPIEKTPTTLAKFDKFLTWSLIVGGVCLMIGLLTRLTAACCAFFLLTVIGAQPPWVYDALPVYEQTVELLALLVLATTAAGRWAGLDFFIRQAFCNCCKDKPAKPVT